MRNKKAFTLVELLVVIAIIALLLSIIAPSLRIARDHATRILCSSNLRSISMAALFYSDDNDGITPSASNRWRGPDGLIRAGWCGRTSDPTTRQPFSLAQQVYGDPSIPGTGLANGQLWPYIETPDVWRCPADPSKDELRSFGMAAQWWSAYTTDDDSVSYDSGVEAGMVHRRISTIRGPSQRFLFVDQAGYNADAYAAIWYSKPMWWNIPNFFHFGGSVNAFADGHVESYRMDAETVRIAREQYDYYLSIDNAAGGFRMPQEEYRDSEDLRYYQMATWGSIGW